ncbi:hypothetical protein PRUPE_8G007100 [Prunus persica]|uniref:Uncharacterized protein n=1 Tax=Prunus persica TaxID=3760 RepID=A0A251MQR4_PRUPE|nr:hypothetical protein PRUPE_8G007100 [Prunus persica]
MEMANTKATSQIPSRAISSGGGGGVCMMSNTWRDEQHPSFINFISTFLTANAFRLNFVPIAPDFIFNCGGSSVAFIFVTSLDPTSISQIFGRFGMELGKPTFVLVKDLEMGFEKMVKIAHSRGVCKREDATAKLKAEVGTISCFVV